VVDRQPLGVSRREVRVRLRGMAQLDLEETAELRQRRPSVMKALEDERGAGFELREHPSDLRHPAERCRAPGDAPRVRGDVELLAGLDQAEARSAQPSGAKKPLEVGDREEVVEPTFLRARDDERPPFPVLVEELLGRDRIDRALEGA
jgi:hypothetical protein